MRNRIESVKVRREVDADPDLSYLGEYSNHASDNSIDRVERGDAGRGEYRYFTPAMTGAQTGNPDSPEHDYQRAEAYNRGAWCMVGVWAEAEVIVSGTVQRIRSGGLWGIESDSDASYFEEVAREQLAELADILAEFIGLSRSAIKRAFPKQVEFSDR
jgi:hypothetical protein